MGYILSLLPVLACPLMMGGMIWMMRGNKEQSAEQTQRAQHIPGDQSSIAVRKSVLDGLQICLNWKVVAGLAVVGAGIWAVRPDLAWAALPVLVVLACPLSMLFMMRGMGSGQCTSLPAQEQRSASVLASDERLSDLRAQHETVTREIANLETALDTSAYASVTEGRASGVQIREHA